MVFRVSAKTKKHMSDEIAKIQRTLTAQQEATVLCWVHDANWTTRILESIKVPSSPSFKVVIATRVKSDVQEDTSRQHMGSSQGFVRNPKATYLVEAFTRSNVTSHCFEWVMGAWVSNN